MHACVCVWCVCVCLYACVCVEGPKVPYLTGLRYWEEADRRRAQNWLGGHTCCYNCSVVHLSFEASSSCEVSSTNLDS